MNGPSRRVVYVANADSHDITVLSLGEGTGALAELQRFPCGGRVMPLAVSPDRRVLHASIRAAPFRVLSLAIDPADGRLRALGEEEPGRLPLLAALETTGPRARSDQGVPQAAVVAGTSAGAAALATATSAANAGASDTASSARILRSTSTPAALRPEMKRL